MDNKDQVKGKVKQAVGDLTDNEDLKKEGKADKQAGGVKEFWRTSRARPTTWSTP